MDKYTAEALRYYLMSDIATGQDADFSEERLIERYNSDLGNSLGNLLNRTLNMVQRYREGSLARHLEPLTEDKYPTDKISWGAAVPPSGTIAYKVTDFPLNAETSLKIWADAMQRFDISRSIAQAILWTTYCNQYIQEKETWTLAKDSGQNLSLATILYHLCESLRIIAILISPVLPKAAHGIFDQLNWKMELSGKEERFSLKDAEWGGLPDGHVVGKPVPLFPRIESASTS